jgi:hypothetical protein
LTDVIWPLDLRPLKQAFYIRTNTKIFESPLTGHVQVQERDGARWVASLSFTRGQADSRRMDALLAALAGPVGSVFMPDFRSLKAKGTLAGSPQLVSGTGATLSLSGFTPEATGVLLAGDLIQTSEGRAHMVVQDIDADVNGEALVLVAPHLRDPVTAGALVTDNCRVVMRLADDNQASNPTDNRLHTSFEIQLMEILPEE